MVADAVGTGNKEFYVFIDDNAHYMDESARSLHGIYDTCDEAYRACRFVVEDSVREFFDYDKTAEEIYELYSLFGVEPWFDPMGQGRRFSAADYAKEYIATMIKLKPFLD